MQVSVKVQFLSPIQGRNRQVNIPNKNTDTRQQKKRMFLLFRFTSLIFYYLLSKLIFLCMAIDFAAFSCHNAISRKTYADFCQNHKFLLTVSVKKPVAACEFSVIYQTGKRYKTLENLTLMQFYHTCNKLHFSKVFQSF